tara:strand:+ start:391 stop:783 length:393 start_codon:yes stop_codon:yes gene_type:complete
MKNNIINKIKYLYYIIFALLIILYLFPGSLIGFFIYSDFERQPELISISTGTFLNHTIYFFVLTFIALSARTKYNYVFTNLYLIFLLAIFLEFLHNFIPNRAFELYDLLANVFGVSLGLTFFKIIKWIRF